MDRAEKELQVMSEGLKSTYDAMVTSQQGGEEEPVDNMSWLLVMYGVAFLDQPVLLEPHAEPPQLVLRNVALRPGRKPRVMDEDGVFIRQLSDAWYYITNYVENNMVRSGWKKE